MGVGYWLTELLKYDRTNGELLTNRSWNYKPPSSKDIPIDWRITLLQKSSNPALVLRSKGNFTIALLRKLFIKLENSLQLLENQR